MQKIKIHWLERYANASPLIIYPPDITGKHFCWGKKEAWKTTERSHSKFQIQLGIRDRLHNYTLITIRGLNNLWFKVGFIERGALWDLTLHLLLKDFFTQRASLIIQHWFIPHGTLQKDHMAVKQFWSLVPEEVANPNPPQKSLKTQRSAETMNISLSMCYIWRNGHLLINN